MTTYSDLLASLKRQDDGALSVHIPADWMQGRTTYGGLSAALCLEAARQLVDVEVMPIRVAQIAFVGPVGGDVQIRANLLRQSKNTAFVRAEILADSGISTQAIFTFGRPRQSQLAYSHVPMPEVKPPNAYENFFRGGLGPGFAKNFEVQLARGGIPVSGSEDPTLGLWLRHADSEAPVDATALLALGDAPPPAALSMLQTPGPISSMTWYVDFLTEQITTEDGWFFAEHTADTAQQGYSSQSMTVWNRAGKPIMLARQMIAVFA